jgi:hypothetical protein
MRRFHSYAAVGLLCGLVWLTVSSVAKTADVTSSDGFARLTECALPNNVDGIEQDDLLWRRIRNAALRDHIPLWVIEQLIRIFSDDVDPRAPPCRAIGLSCIMPRQPTASATMNLCSHP